MATQTRFDLNAAMEGWRNELAAQPQLSSDDRRELEKHLADTMAELRQRGLNEEESFWLARRRIGRPKQLAEEFEKADPVGVWRERVFWMALAILIFFLWECLVGRITLLSGWIPRYCQSYIYFFLIWLMPICLAILLAKGKLNFPVLGTAFKNRWLFASSTIAILLLADALQTWVASGFHMTKLFWVNQILYFGFPLMIVALVTWLLPARKTAGKNPVLS